MIMIKTRNAISLAATMVALMLLVACAKTQQLPVLSKNDVVLAFGDSITFGTGAAPEESYPVVLEQIIGRRVINAGIQGEVTAEGLARLPDVLDREKPLIVIICLGGNDFLRRMNKKETAGNIREMVRICKQKGAAVVLLAVPAPGLSMSPEPIYCEIAKDLTVVLEEKTLSSILADGTLKSDIIHPNAAGYRRLAEAVRELLKKTGAIE